MCSGISIQNASILLVDDEPVNIELLSEILRLNGYCNIHCITDSRNVRTFCDKHEVDLMLLDFNMPHMDGIDIIKQLRKNNRTSEIPIVILTAQADTNIRQKVLREGAKDILIKPFIHVDLLCKIRDILTIHLFHKHEIREA